MVTTRGWKNDLSVSVQLCVVTGAAADVFVLAGSAVVIAISGSQDIVQYTCGKFHGKLSARLFSATANNIDFTFSGGAITGSPAVLDIFESQGTTLAAFLASQGITGDLNNLSLAELGINQAESFDIFRLDTTADGTNRITTGDTNGSFTGETPALRPISLDPDPNAPRQQPKGHFRSTRVAHHLTQIFLVITWHPLLFD